MHYWMVLSEAFVWEYAQKYIAREGATPTMFGPSPLNNALDPSVFTMYLGGKEIKLYHFQ